jgi:hypothetical protein
VRETRAVTFDDLRWTGAEIPGSAPPVELARLRAEEATGAFSALVRFPPGWSRPGSGYYRVHEELFVVEGDLTVSGETYRPGDYAWLPAEYLRSGSGSGGALVLARFSGPPAWVPSQRAGEGFRPEEVVRKHWTAAQRRPSPLGTGEARLLRGDARLSSWVLEEDGCTGTARHAAELFSLPERSWAWVGVNERLPPVAPPCFFRLFGAPAETPAGRVTGKDEEAV